MFNDLDDIRAGKKRGSKEGDPKEGRWAVTNIRANTNMTLTYSETAGGTAKVISSG